MDKICKEADENTEFYKKISNVAESRDKLKCIELLIQHYNCDFDNARMVIDYIIDGTPLPSDLSPAEIAHNNAVAQEWQNKPKCICCGSTNLKKISGLSKAGSVAVWGIFAAGRTSKTWHCNNCGTEW
jgi:hypothetical protein